MSDHPLEQLDPQVLGSDSPINTVHSRKRKLHEFLDTPKSISKELTRPSSTVSQVSNNSPGNIQFVASTLVIQEAKLQSTLQPSPPSLAQVIMDIFPENIPKPVIKTELPHLHERIENTEQLVYCTSLLSQDSLSPATVPGVDAAGDDALCLQESTLDKTELDWLVVIKKEPLEQDYLRWLLTRMVEAFVADTTKDSVELAEIVALGPVLQKELYRKLLSSLIKDFDDARILDVNLLQGLVELIQSASSDYLVSDDLVRILSTLRARLQGTHQQSTEHSYHLTLAVSKVLDVMADHKMQDVDRVLQHEPLSRVLSGLKGSSDPYLMYQACYAFQALQYIPDDESALQAVLRHSIGMANGLVKVSAVFKLDLASILKGISRLQESVGGIIGLAATVYEGVSSLIKSGQGVLDNLKEGLSTGQKQPWYPAIKAAYAFAQAGQLKNLRQLIFEAPCRRDPLFQWGICQLLGEIAISPVWAAATRQQAIALLGHLFKVDRDWGRDESVKAWMLTIVIKLEANSNHVVNTVAHALLQGLDQDQCTSIQHSYPLATRTLIPASSRILAKVHNKPSVKYHLHKLRLQRLNDAHLSVYIPPMAKANLQASDYDLFPLMDKVQEFLASDRQVMLILGDSGSGKSTFNKHLELMLLQSYTHGGRIPLFINLPAMERPKKELITEQLRTYNFSETQIQELKQHRRFVVICDGYDESQLTTNLHTSNFFNRPDQWDVKLVITCRSQYLGQDYHDRFVPNDGDHYSRPTFHLFQEAAIAPFSKQQIQDYIDQYVPLETRTWTTQDYMDKLTTIPNLMDLVKNPFLLSLSLEALPKVTKGRLELSTIKITRVHLYDTFVEHWLDVNKRRLQKSVLSEEDRATLDNLLKAGFVALGVEFSTKLASAIFEQQDGNPVVQYIHVKDLNTWKVEYFSPYAETRFLRESSPLSCTDSQFRFLHRSILEYFLSRAVFDPSTHVYNDKFSPQPDPDPTVAQPLDPHGPLFTRNLLDEPSIIQFLCERVKQHPDFEKQLRAVIEQSKTDPTATVATAAANAITILVRAGVRFNGEDFRGIRIPGADLTDSQLDSAQLQDADLTDVTFAGSWMRQVDLSGAQMNGVRFGELPFLKKSNVAVCAYSPNSRMLALGGQGTFLSVYDTTTWSSAYRHIPVDANVSCAAFSPNNQQLAYGTIENSVRLWTIANNDTVLDMEGHAEWVRSVAFSPCGKQLASASDDRTVRLWSSETGECVLVLKGHADAVAGVTYSSDGKRLVSGSSKDGTIRVWASDTGELVACWNIAHEEDSCLALSADGKWVAVTLGTKIQITNAITGELGPILDNKSKTDCIAFSSNEERIVTSGPDDNTLRLWDLSSGLLISSFAGHADEIHTCNFSPDGLQLVSGDEEGYVRLWEVDTSRAVLDLDRPTSPVYILTYSPDGQSIVSGSRNQGIQKWESRTGVSAPLPLKIAYTVSSLTFSPDGNQTATGHEDGTIRLWSRHADIPECILLGHTQVVIQLVYSRCGRWIVSFGYTQVRLWDLHTNKHPGFIAQMDLTRLVELCVAFTPTGQIVLSLDDRTLRLHDPHAQDPCTPLKKISTRFKIVSLDSSPDGQEVAIGANNGKVYLWNLESNKPFIELNGHCEWVYSVAYSPCGKWILASSRDKAVRIWRSRTGEDGSWSCVNVVGGCSEDIDYVAWNPRVALEFATGCEDGSVRVWRIAIHDDADGGDVSVQMLWGNDVGRLCALDLKVNGTIGLSPMNQKLLVQRGAIDDSPPSEGHEAVGGDTDQFIFFAASMWR